MDSDTMMECLKDLVGVANNSTGTICRWSGVSQDVKDAAALSTSGLFLDRLPGGVDLSRIDKAEVLEKLISLGIEARDQAIIDFRNDLIMAIGVRNKSSKRKYTGNIGRIPLGVTLASNGQIQAIEMVAKDAIAGFIHIPRMQIAVNGAGTFNVYIGRGNKGATEIEEIVGAYPVTTIGNQWVQIPLNGDKILLPLSINDVAQQYHVYWDRVESGGLSPKENDVKCGCATDSGMQTLYDYMSVNGAQFPDITHLKNRILDNKGRGLSLDVVVSCNSELIVCNEFQNNEISVGMSYGVYYKAGVLWIEKIMKLGDVVRELITNREYLWGKRNHYEKEYNTRVTYVADNADLNSTNCYVCREEKMVYDGIYS